MDSARFYQADKPGSRELYDGGLGFGCLGVACCCWLCCLPVTLLFACCLAAADVAWYEGRYPSQLAAPGQQQKRGAARRAALAVTDTGEGPAACKKWGAWSLQMCL